MYNILEHKQEIAKNIQKAFGNTLEDIEKAKWQIGEVRVDSRGIAHECFEYVNGKPHLRRVKKNKGVSTTSTDNNGGKKQVDKPEQKNEDLFKVGELKNGFKFKKDTEYVLRYNKYEKQYEVFENKTQRGAGKVPMWVCKSDNGDEKFGEKILKVVQKNYAKEGSTISFGNKIYPLSLNDDNSGNKQVNTQSQKKVDKVDSDISFQLFDRKSGHSKYYEISPIPNELKNSSFIRIISAKDSKSGRKEYVPEIEFKDGEKFSERLFSKKDAINFVKEKILEKRNKANDKEEFTESSFKNSFDSIISNILSIVDKVYVEKPVGNDYSTVDKTYKTSDWKKGVHVVGNDFYGKDELLQLDVNKKGGDIQTIQLRKPISNGMGSAYNNQPIGHVIVEVAFRNKNGWSKFDMTKENSRKDFAELLNKNIKK